MNIEELCNHYAQTAQGRALKHLLDNPSETSVTLSGLTGSAAAMLFAGQHPEGVVVFILPDADEAGYFYHDLTQIRGSHDVLFFPSSYRRALKYGQRDAANEVLRTEVLSRLGSQQLFVVTHPEALAELVVSRESLGERMLSVKVGQTVNVMDVRRQLLEWGFSEVDYVYEPGQFALRGSLFDVYSYSCEWPFRVDFFGNDVDSIRTFEVQDQLSKDRRSEVHIVPELSALSADRVPFLRLLPAGSILVTPDLRFVSETIGRIYRDGFSEKALHERLSMATEVERDQLLRDMRRESQLSTASQFDDEAARMRIVHMPASSTTLSAPESGGQSAASLSFSTVPQPLFHKNMELLRHTFEDFQLQGYTVYVLADSDKQHERLREILASAAPPGQASQALPQAPQLTFVPISKTLHAGFVDREARACFFTDHQIFDRFHKYSLKSDKARTGKMALSLKELQEMEVGDYLVHIDFGIGKFGGLVRVPIPGGEPGAYQEVIRMIFQHNDKVDVSIHSLYKISKYRRSDTGEPPRLSILGSGAWERLKERTKKRVKDIARDLIRLYAKRRSEKGFAFSADSFLQHELEASFLYEDTPDQLKATTDVKADMERSQPMDRLVCGDVGFGKTEVAVRAAFKAACDSKQVAVLVPTTVLAFQHFQTFRDRLRDMPVRVDYLSRARSAKQTRQVLEDLREGKIDILIGTHKLIGKQVVWKDLGLLIIDEEQKFGVAVKERLRKLKTSVDTLTMSATPIPRTLQFSLMGARDMSIIRTPPPNRHPIHTESGSFSGELIADAINFEMSRNGQVYFVNDRISNLPEIERLILKYVPDCRVAIGHGQMKPEELENIVMGFINYDYDVLLSTTIVENGIDIPNANTIIINDAHKFGLSDLHQMRGRVGRSNRKAFCYLLSPPKSVLSPEARRRLEALETFSDLGSGFSLAMQDLDIRGAGNLLGAEQSGFMEDLGYETYLKIIKQAMAELRDEATSQPQEDGQSTGAASPSRPASSPSATASATGGRPAPLVAQATWEGTFDCALESDLEMYFPDTYVPGSSERLLLYRELDNIETEEALQAYRRRLEDRFGPVPRQGRELMQVVALRRLGKRLGCEKIILRQGLMQMQFVSNAASSFYHSQVFDRILSFVTANVRRCTLKEVRGRRLLSVGSVSSVEEAVGLLRRI